VTAEPEPRESGAMRFCILLCVMAVLTGCSGPPVSNPNMVSRPPSYVWPEANQVDVDTLPLTR
jgi:hypothetical protein